MARVKKRNLNMAWIDYRKAYDMVPHSWIVEMLRMVRVLSILGFLGIIMGFF